MRIGRTMYIFLGFLLLFYALFGAIGYWQLIHFATLVEAIHDHPLKVTKGTLTSSRNVVRISRNVKDMLLVRDVMHRKQRLAEIEQDERDTDQQLALVLDRIAGQEGKDLVRRAIDLTNTQKNLREQITTEIFNGNDKKGELLARTQGIPLMKQLEESMAKISNYADSQSMAYHVQSVSDLKRAKIVLIAAGLIVAIFSIVFTVLAFRSFHNSMKRASSTLSKASEKPIDLTVAFDKNSPGQIGIALTGFFSILRSAVRMIRDRHSILEVKLGELQAHAEVLPSACDQISSHFQAVITKINALLDVRHDGGSNFKLPFEILEQIKGDLNLLLQFIATKDLLMEKLKLAKDASEINEVIDSLKSHNKSMRENVERTTRSLDSVNELLKSLLTRLNDLQTAVNENSAVLQDMEDLTEDHVHTQEIAHELKTVADELESRIKDFKLS